MSITFTNLFQLEQRVKHTRSEKPREMPSAMWRLLSSGKALTVHDIVYRHKTNSHIYVIRVEGERCKITVPEGDLRAAEAPALAVSDKHKNMAAEIMEEFAKEPEVTTVTSEPTPTEHISGSICRSFGIRF